MTEDEIITRVLETTGLTESQLPAFRILGLLTDARVELADQIAASGDREEREHLRKTFTIAFGSNGRAPLTTPLTAAEPLFLKYFDQAEIYLDGVSRRVTLLPDESAVKLDRGPGFPFGALIGSELLVYNGGSAFQGGGTIRGLCVPSLVNITSPVDKRFVTIIGGMATGQIPSPTKRTAQELKTVAAEGK